MLADKMIKQQNKLSKLNITQKSAFCTDEEVFTSLSTTALLAKSMVPFSHKRVADNYIIIKRIYKFQSFNSRISNHELNLLKKYDFNPLEYSTIKQINEEISLLKNWSQSPNEQLRAEADEIMTIRAKELKYVMSSKYLISNEIYNGYMALEKYFEEITKYFL